MSVTQQGKADLMPGSSIKDFCITFQSLALLRIQMDTFLTQFGF